MNDEAWGSVDEVAGLPVTFFHSGDQLLTKSAVAVQARSGGGLAVAQSMLSQVLCEALILPNEAVVPAPDGSLVLDLTLSDIWLTTVEPCLDDVLTADVSPSSVSLRIAGKAWSVSDAAQVVGTEALSWAVQRSASAGSPFVIAPGLEVWEGRTDANPLSVVRRAHAALVVRDRPRAGEAWGHGSTPVADAGVRAAILLASRRAFDASRSRRTRPAVLAVEKLAAASLSHLCHTPVTRTDALAVSVARRVLADALDAAGITAPVPY